MNNFILLRLLSILLLFQLRTNAQVSIINVPIQSFNLTPEALLNVNIMNTGAERRVKIVSQLMGSNNTILLTVKSGVFQLNKGLNSVGTGSRKVESFEFSNSPQANYLKTTHNLASGRYKICCTVTIENDAETIEDFCEELEADFNQYLYLINPFDEDTVESLYPILSWTHSEPFSILNQGEFYRMVVTEIKDNQTAEEAITINSPVMVKNYLKEHQLQYPYDARELKAGRKYAWQVQKLSDGVPINKTESWIFYTRKVNEMKSMKYVTLRNELDGSYYVANEGLVYFAFSEDYKSQGKLKLSLTNSHSQLIDVTIKKDEGKDEDVGIKNSGDNRYELNLTGKKLKSGFYTLEIKNEKNESFYLKIFLP